MDMPKDENAARKRRCGSLPLHANQAESLRADIPKGASALPHQRPANDQIFSKFHDRAE